MCINALTLFQFIQGSVLVSALLQLSGELGPLCRVRNLVSA